MGYIERLPEMFRARPPDVIVHGAVATNPAANAVIVDTGELPGAAVAVVVTDLGTTSAAGTNLSRLEHRDAANAVNLAAKRLWGGDDYHIDMSFFRVTAAKQRIRVLNLGAAVVGDVQMSFYVWLLP